MSLIFGEILTGPNYARTADLWIQQRGGRLILVLDILNFTESSTTSLHTALIKLRSYFSESTLIRLSSFKPVSPAVLSSLSSAAGISVINQVSDIFNFNPDQARQQIIEQAQKAPPRNLTLTDLRQKQVADQQKLHQLLQDVALQPYSANSPAKTSYVPPADDYIRK